MFFRLCLILFLLSSNYVYALQYDARVIKVIDGDTIWVKSNNKHIKIRLSYIDAPEIRQKFGVKSRDILIGLIQNKKIEVHVNKKDRYNRQLGEIYIHEADKSIFINAKMLKSGSAWVYKHYRNNMYLMNLENSARINKNGLWNENDPLEPWKFREQYQR